MAEAERGLATVDEHGVRIGRGGSGDAQEYAGVLDVLLDGRRVWSFRPARDGEPADDGVEVPWPQQLARFLDGQTRLSVVDHVTGEVWFEQECQFGTSGDRITMVNERGVPLGIDNTGTLIPTFDSRSEADVQPLLDTVEEVLDFLRDRGVDAFPGYGTLLGAVREQRLLGHDSDVDLAYVSRHDHPFDVVRESFGLQRDLVRAGYATKRYSGAAFKVDVIEGDGTVRGLDVFGGFMREGHLHLLGEISTPFEESWIRPLGECTLAGRTLPAPARADKLLEVTYGEGWRVPDPAFRYETPESTKRRLGGWFRGLRQNRSKWEDRYRAAEQRLPPITGSSLARMAREGVEPGSQMVELAAGRGSDALWLARQGFAVTAYDVVPSASRAVQRQAARKGFDLTVRGVNYSEWRSVLAEGTLLAHRPGPRTLLARHAFDVLGANAQDRLARLCSMALRDGGQLFAQVWTGDGKQPYPIARPMPLDGLTALLERQGADIVSASEQPVAAGASGPRYSWGTVVAQWRT